MSFYSYFGQVLQGSRQTSWDEFDDYQATKLRDRSSPTTKVAVVVAS